MSMAMKTLGAEVMCQHPAPSTKCQIPSTKYQAPSTQYPVPSTRHASLFFSKNSKKYLTPPPYFLYIATGRKTKPLPAQLLRQPKTDHRKTESRQTTNRGFCYLLFVFCHLGFFFIRKLAFACKNIPAKISK